MDVQADTSSEPWTLQVGDQACNVAEWHWMGDTPCFSGVDGVRDVSLESD